MRLLGWGAETGGCSVEVSIGGRAVGGRGRAGRGGGDRAGGGRDCSVSSGRVLAFLGRWGGAVKVTCYIVMRTFGRLRRRWVPGYSR